MACLNIPLPCWHSGDESELITRLMLDRLLCTAGLISRLFPVSHLFIFCRYLLVSFCITICVRVLVNDFSSCSNWFTSTVNIIPHYCFFVADFLCCFVLLSSAGVGRTGTFMVIDSTLDRIKAESTIDIFNFVAYLRTRRTAMVQTEVCNTSLFILMKS